MQAAAAAFRAVVEELADLDAGGDQLVPGGHDVGNDQECPGRTGSGRRDVLAEMDRAAGARRRELDQAEIFAGGAVNVEPPSDPLVNSFARSTSETGMTTTSSFMSILATPAFLAASLLRTSLVLMVTSCVPWGIAVAVLSTKE